MRLTTRLMLPLVVVVAAGCGDDARVPVFPVHGQVQIQGKPAIGAQVVFHPRGKIGPEAVRPSGQVDGQGNFTLTTHASGDGAPEGDYDVTVEWWVSKNDNPAVNLLPARYQRAQTSGLHAHVSAGDNQVAPFKLTR